MPEGITKPFIGEVWDVFRAFDIAPFKTTNAHSKVSYITWSRVWSIIMDLYPESHYVFEEDRITSMTDDGPCETVMVKCTVVIIEGERKAHREMWLPVMQNSGQFKAIENPTAREISDTRMRCLVKCAAMFGLGLSLWEGEDLAAVVDKAQERAFEFMKMKSAEKMELWRYAIVIKDAFIAGDDLAAFEVWQDLSDNEKTAMWLAETKGGFFTQLEKEWIRQLSANSEGLNNNEGEA